MLGCVLVFLLGLLAPAQAQEFRRITLSDGRALAARVDATTADGLTLSVPQGQVRVPFTLVMNIENIDEATWQGQPTWEVLLLPFGGPAPLSAEAEAATREALARLPATRVSRLGDLSGKLDPGTLAALSACGANLDCALPHAAKAGMSALVTATVLPGDPARVLLRGVFVATPTVRGEGDASISGAPYQHPRELLTAAALSLLVMPSEATLASLPAALTPPAAATPAKPPEVVATPTPTPAPEPRPPREPMDEAKLRAMAWVPLPGAPALAKKDWGGVAASWALAVPSSALLIYGAGQGAMTKGELIGMSALSAYGSIVASNLLFGAR